MDRAINQAAVELIDRLGGLSAVAKATGVSRQAVLKWRRHGVPPDREQSLRHAFRLRVADVQPAVGRGRIGPRS